MASPARRQCSCSAPALPSSALRTKLLVGGVALARREARRSRPTRRRARPSSTGRASKPSPYARTRLARRDRLDRVGRHGDRHVRFRLDEGDGDEQPRPPAPSGFGSTTRAVGAARLLADERPDVGRRVPVGLERRARSRGPRPAARRDRAEVGRRPSMSTQTVERSATTKIVASACTDSPSVDVLLDHGAGDRRAELVAGQRSARRVRSRPAVSPSARSFCSAICLPISASSSLCCREAVLLGGDLPFHSRSSRTKVAWANSSRVHGFDVLALQFGELPAVDRRHDAARLHAVADVLHAPRWQRPGAGARPGPRDPG